MAGLRHRLVMAASLWMATPAQAGARVALLVAHPLGGEDLTPLRYTAQDLERMRDVLQSVGNFAADDVLVSFGEDADDVLRRFDDAATRLSLHDAKDSLFVFYYSGHSKDGELRLGETRVGLQEIKQLIEHTGAALRIALIDSCRAGAITRMKGAVKGEPLTMAVEDGAAQLGQVLITASSDYEDAQESDAIQGSFFTHYLTTALRGAGDDNRDGQVTLTEAYSFAYANTVGNTIGTQGGIQHPTYRFDLRGAGDVVLTSPGELTSALLFPAGMAGHFVVFDLGRQVVVAEFTKGDQEPARLAVTPGHYAVKKRESDHLKIARLVIRADQETAVVAAAMERVEFANDYAKGATVSVEEIRDGKLGLRLTVSAGSQAFLSAPARDDYFPSLGMVGVAVDFDHVLRKNLGVRLDLGLGGSGERSLRLEDPLTGRQDFAVVVSELTFGAALIGRMPIRDWLDAGLSGRLGFISVSRHFQNIDLPAQAFATLTPGLGAELDWKLADWCRLGLRVRIHYMFFNVDTPLSLLYVDGGLVATAVVK